MSTEDQRGSNNPNANPNAPASGGADSGSGAGASGEPPRAPNPNARLRELLSIPERLRTDAQWDEIIEIEISMGPRKPSGNFSKSPHQSKSSNQSPSRQNERGDRPDNKKPMGGGGKHSHSRKRRPGGGGGGGSGGHGKQE